MLSAPPRQRVLVVDDDENTLKLVSHKLDYAGFEVLKAASGEEALAVVEQHGLPHLAIVDIQLPGMDGFEFCRTIQKFCDLPVIILTAVDEEDMIVQGIERFAEDYITKPFSPRELVARVQRVLRRVVDRSYASEPIVQVDDELAVDFVHQQAMVAGHPITLRPLEAKLLYILLVNRGRIVTNEFLLDRLWPMDEVFEDTLRVHVHRLRKKIEGSPSHPNYIVTERGLGYVFQAPQRCAA